MSDGDVDERYDGMFATVAQQKGSITALLTTFFSFLARRTDFYVADPNPKRRMGFAPGVAEQLVVQSFRKFPLRDPSGRLQPHVASSVPAVVSGKSAPAAAAADSSKMASVASPAAALRGTPSPTTSASSSSVALGGAGGRAAPSAVAAGAAAPGSSSSSPAQAAAAGSPAVPVAATPASSSSTAAPSAAASSASAIAVRYSTAGKQVPIGNGGVGPGGVYWWTQTLHEVLLHVAVPAGVRVKKQLSVRVDKRSICIKATLPLPAAPAGSAPAGGTGAAAAVAAAGGSGGAEAVVLLSGPLYGAVAVDRETCGADGVMWSWDREPAAGGERPRLPPPAALPPLPESESALRTLQSTAGGAGAGGSAESFDRLQAALWLPSSASASTAPSTAAASLSAPMPQPHLLPGGGVLTVPLEKLEDTWWRRITAHPDGGVPGALASAAAAASAGGAGASDGSSTAGGSCSSAAAASAAIFSALPAGTPSPPPSDVAALSSLAGPWDIDAAAVDSTREVGDYDPDTQAAIRRIVYEQSRGTPGHEIEGQLKEAEAARAQAAAREHASAAAVGLAAAAPLAGSQASTSAAASAGATARSETRAAVATAVPATSAAVSAETAALASAALAAAAPASSGPAPQPLLSSLAFAPEAVARDPSLLWGTGGTAATRSPPDSGDEDDEDDADGDDTGKGKGKETTSARGGVGST